MPAAKQPLLSISFSCDRLCKGVIFRQIDGMAIAGLGRSLADFSDEIIATHPRIAPCLELGVPLVVGVPETKHHVSSRYRLTGQIEEGESSCNCVAESRHAGEDSR
jgi:hypothetical protein